MAHKQDAPCFFEERLRIPADLLARLAAEDFRQDSWFPLFRDADGTAVVALAQGREAAGREAAATALAGLRLRFVPAAPGDIARVAADYKPAVTGAAVGVVRTNLAHWRNTMAHWRTHLACWRTDMATGRTWLSVSRFGLGLMALGNTLLRGAQTPSAQNADIACLVFGLVLAGAAAGGYLRLRFSRRSLPGVQTLVEISAATLQFLEEYHFIDSPGRRRPPSKPTMLARLGDMLENHATILEIASGAPERIHLARERNVLAAQRTVCACYRTIAARARTGLAFIRTGVAVLSLGIGLLRYYGGGPLSLVDWLLAVVGAAMVVDGLLWYWPVRQEPVRTPRCVDPPGERA
ncbi:DUF202 domain-containing protein [Solidesulfovibrio alcoholivorans]|uniref:DUF202 domain-containing protein n=1 Tax=Solidesulfovibrio alcoholivorans TaxID=81406 RepID=UPI000496E8B0|nr:general secretion pathway protein GspE [Solidesulfovibrio alcoholivorans]